MASMALRRAGVGVALLGAWLCTAGCEPASQASVAPAPAPVDAASPAEGSRFERVDGLRFEIPESWISRPPQSSMRLAEYRVSGEAGDADLVLFRFPGGGGSADANVARWIGQYAQPDGTPSADRAVVQTAQQQGLTLTRLDIRGRYEGQDMPGAPPQPPIEDARLLALVVEGAGDPYFFKLQGSAAAVAPWMRAWEKLTESVARE